MEHEEYTYTYGMDEAAMVERLESTATGVLALADGDDAYGVPVAHSYRDDRLFLRLGASEDSRKMSFVASGGLVTYVVYDDEPLAESWSVVVEGRLHELDPGGQGFDATWLNETFPPIRVFDEDVEDVEEAVYELEIESITGRTASA